MIKLRFVNEQDCDILWHWVNQPEVRASAFCSDFIPWEQHQEWFKQKLGDSKCYIFIALDQNNLPIGQVRFDTIDQENAEIDVSVDKLRRGLGYGHRIIQIATDKILKITSIAIIHAYIKISNKPSIKTFEKSGFVKNRLTTIKGNLVLHYQKERI